MGRIAFRFWQVNLAEQWQYRANTLMYLLYWLISPIVYLALWTAIAREQGSVNGMVAGDFVAYYLVALIVNILTSTITPFILAPKIEDGTLSGNLLLPVDPILTQVLMNNLAFKALQVVVMIPVWALLYWLYQPQIDLTLPNLLLSLVAIPLAFGILYFNSVIITAVAFWTTRMWAVSNVYMAVFTLVSGEFVPINLLPAAMQSVARVLPYQLTVYFPTQLLLGKVPFDQALMQIGLQVIWCAVMFVAYRAVWRAGVRRFSAVGA